MAEKPGDLLLEVPAAVGFGKEAKDFSGQEHLRALYRGITAAEEDRNAGRDLADAVHNLKAMKLRHHEIKNDEVQVRGMIQEQIQTLLPVHGFLYLETEPFKDLAGHEADAYFILDQKDPDPGHWRCRGI
jgi:hypothetical protein